MNDSSDDGPGKKGPGGPKGPKGPKDGEGGPAGSGAMADSSDDGPGKKGPGGPKGPKEKPEPKGKGPKGKGPGKKDEDQVDNENAGEAGDDESRALTPKERKAAEKAPKKAKSPKGHALKKICAEATEEADCPTDKGCEWRKPTKKECKPTKSNAARKV